MKRTILLAGLTAATCLLGAPGWAAQAEPCGDAATLNTPCERPLPPCQPLEAPCNR